MFSSSKAIQPQLSLQLISLPLKVRLNCCELWHPPPSPPLNNGWQCGLSGKRRQQFFCVHIFFGFALAQFFAYSFIFPAHKNLNRFPTVFCCLRFCFPVFPALLFLKYFLKYFLSLLFRGSGGESGGQLNYLILICKL